MEMQEKGYADQNLCTNLRNVIIFPKTYIKEAKETNIGERRKYEEKKR
jgi:hypothetical protein